MRPTRCPVCHFIALESRPSQPSEASLFIVTLLTWSWGLHNLPHQPACLFVDVAQKNSKKNATMAGIDPTTWALQVRHHTSRPTFHCHGTVRFQEKNFSGSPCRSVIIQCCKNNFYRDKCRYIQVLVGKRKCVMFNTKMVRLDIAIQISQLISVPSLCFRSVNWFQFHHFDSDQSLCFRSDILIQISQHASD
jgi:hypothetical protein